MKKKRILGILLAIIMIMSINVGGYAEGSKDAFIYNINEGNYIEYMLDENMMPYIIENGQRINLAIPLKHLKVNNTETLRSLNENLIRYTAFAGILPGNPVASHNLSNGP